MSAHVHAEGHRLSQWFEAVPFFSWRQDRICLLIVDERKAAYIYRYDKSDRSSGVRSRHGHGDGRSVIVFPPGTRGHHVAPVARWYELCHSGGTLQLPQTAETYDNFLREPPFVYTFGFTGQQSWESRVAHIEQRQLQTGNLSYSA